MQKSNKKVALFPGSFDPLTIGHASIVARGLALVDEVIVAIGVNSQKVSYFSLEQRLQSIQKVFAHEPRVKVVSYSGLTISFCKSIGAQFILRGLRTSADFEFERTIAQMNKDLDPAIETLFLLTNPELSHINSTVVREVLRNGGDASKFVPQGLDLKPHQH